MEAAASVQWTTPMTTCSPCGTGRRRRGWRTSRSVCAPAAGPPPLFPAWSRLPWAGALSPPPPPPPPQRDPFSRPQALALSPQSQGLAGFLLLFMASVRVLHPHSTATSLLIHSIAPSFTSSLTYLLMSFLSSTNTLFHAHVKVVLAG